MLDSWEWRGEPMNELRRGFLLFFAAGHSVNCDFYEVSNVATSNTQMVIQNDGF